MTHPRPTATPEPTPDLQSIGRLPRPEDNVAIAIRDLEGGSAWRLEGREYVLSQPVLEGHRFAIRPISAGTSLLSWSLPFGTALRDIAPGEYVCNANMLKALSLRDPGFELPAAPNFRDQPHGYRLDPSAFAPGQQVAPCGDPGQFMGYPRPGGRGTGTRNCVVILGTSSRTGSLARALEARLKGAEAPYPNIDGIVAIAHTEGGAGGDPNNRELLLRTLAGFIVHPNVAALLALDLGDEAVTNEMLARWLREHDYPIDHVPHHFHSVARDFATELESGEAIVRDWLETANAAQREPCPLSGLRVALQCGGSDAFSGISGNPLAAWVAREVIRHGGSAGLAETDELIGAEPYVLANCRDLATAARFLERIEAFRERIGWHGHSAEGNPTGGNLYRGLYNITLKSIGAARKKDPEVRLDQVIGYGERMSEPGFYFMDSPGNDLESVAGQVASGCNLVFFITGNGSITNFPFAPTVKFVTTTRRWKLLERDMDINAGEYLDGRPMDELGAAAFRYAIDAASGTRTAGERARHAQVSIWRNWRLSAPRPQPEARSEPDGAPIAVRGAAADARRFSAWHTSRGIALERVGLIMPTSLCSGQIAGQIATRLNARQADRPGDLARFVALAHTEGCGASSGDNEAHYLRTVVGHLQHPCVAHALLLEHGCEKTHNALMRHALEAEGIDPGRFGYASIQLDGGIAKVSDRVERWFADQAGETEPPATCEAGLADLVLGLLSSGPSTPAADRALALLAATLVGSGGTVIVAENTGLLDSAVFLDALGLPARPQPTLGYARAPAPAGFHVMATPTNHPVETLAGLGAAGAHLLLAHTGGAPLQGHPMIPTLQVGSGDPAGTFAADLDCVVPAGDTAAEAACEGLLQLLRDCAQGSYRPPLWLAGHTDFQVTRGLLGVSL